MDTYDGMRNAYVPPALSLDELRLEQIKREAKQLLMQEKHDLAVQKELKKLRAERGRSLWQRLIDKLPFTIRRKTR